MSKHPVGATWVATDKNTGLSGRIWLQERSGGFEVWYWSSCWSDLSDFRFDWGRNYASVRKECPVNGKFKRIKSECDVVTVEKEV